MNSALLEVRSLYKSYDEGKIEALRGVDLSIASGEFLAITGPSGSGKSTLLHMLGGLDSPTQRRGSFPECRAWQIHPSRHLPVPECWLHFPGVPPDAHVARNRECATADDRVKWHAA